MSEKEPKESFEPSQSDELIVTRRQFLETMGILVAGGALSSCAPSLLALAEPGTPTPFTPREAETATPEQTPQPITTSSPGEMKQEDDQHQLREDKKREKNKDFPDTILTRVMVPYYMKALKQREGLHVFGSEQEARINERLNVGRVNYYIEAQFEQYEPPATKEPGKRFGGGMIISVNLISQTIDVVMFSHDLFSPRIAQLLKKPWIMEPDTRIDQGYTRGGLKEMGDDMERATGLFMDYRVAMNEKKVAGFIDQIGGINLKVPFDIDTAEYFWDGVLQPKMSFRPDISRHVNGKEAIGFFKSLPVEKEYTKKREQRNRGMMIFDGVVSKLVDEWWNIPGAYTYLNDLFEKKGIDSDFKLEPILDPQYLTWPSKPRIRFSYFAEKQASDIGGLVRPPNRMDMYIPEGAKLGPTVNELQDYWGPLRKRVEERLLAP